MTSGAVDNAVLVRQLLQVASLTSAEVSETLGRLGLTRSTAAVLWTVSPERRGTRLQQLSTQLGCDRSNATLLSAQLEDAGLAKRTTDPTDRRVRSLVLTAAGRRKRAALLTAITPISGIDRLSAAERRTLSALLARLGATVET